jgi:hypothetical protein
MSILQRLYDSEINFEVSAFYDAGFDVRLGDHLNGFLVKNKVDTWADALCTVSDRRGIFFARDTERRPERRIVLSSSLLPSLPQGSSTDNLRETSEGPHCSPVRPTLCAPGVCWLLLRHVRASLPSSPAERPPSGPGWLHEIKLDGFRMLARRDAAGVRLLTRNGIDWAGRYPGIISAVNGLRCRTCLIDREVVICGEDRIPIFNRR